MRMCEHAYLPVSHHTHFGALWPNSVIFYWAAESLINCESLQWLTEKKDSTQGLSKVKIAAWANPSWDTRESTWELSLKMTRTSQSSKGPSAVTARLRQTHVQLETKFLSAGYEDLHWDWEQPITDQNYPFVADSLSYAVVKTFLCLLRTAKLGLLFIG